MIATVFCRCREAISQNLNKEKQIKAKLKMKKCAIAHRNLPPFLKVCAIVVYKSQNMSKLLLRMYFSLKYILQGNLLLCFSFGFIA